MSSAADLLAALVERGIARETKAAPGSEQTVRSRRHGIEIARLGVRDPRRLASFWKKRSAGKNLRLIAVADNPEQSGALLVFGPQPGAPLRSLSAEAFLRELERAEGLSSAMLAVRSLASAFARFDHAETPGLSVRGLLTGHALTERFLRLPAFRQDREDASRAVRNLPRDSDWADLLKGLGWHLEQLSVGFLARDGGKPGLVVLPFPPGEDFAKLDGDGRSKEGRLLALAGERNVRYGLLASGGRVRLFDSESEAAVSRWLELDAATLDPEGRPLLALLGPDFLVRGRFEKLATDARDYGISLWKRLGDRIHDRALPALARGLDGWARSEERDITEEATRRDLQHASLTLLFRLLFLFYAESAGFLPMGNAIYRGKSLTALAAEARSTRKKLDRKSTALWQGFRNLVLALRSGNSAWGVSAYNGALFDKKELEGAETLEQIELADPDFGAILIALGTEDGDDDEARGVDYSSLEIGHLGNIYESLLSLNLVVTDRPTRYDPATDRYRHVEGTGDIPAGMLFWQNHEGGRKAGGVYYTPTTLVRHLVDRAVRPAYREHLERVGKIAEKDPERAAGELLDFAVADPACGSGHFLVAVVDALADEAARFLAETPLPALRERLDALRSGTESDSGGSVEDLALLRRLLVKHSVFGVDVSPMGVEIATVSLWLASFVPGLSLSYLGRNVVVGNSLFGVADRDAVIQPNTFEARGLGKWLDRAGEAVARVASGEDRTPEEVAESQSASREADTATSGLRRVFDLWTAEAFGNPGGRDLVTGHGDKVVTGKLDQNKERKIEAARETSLRHFFLHWPLEFPRQFHREASGFDAVVGNPPWEEVTVEELGFYTLFEPGLHALPQGEREFAVSDLVERRPDLAERLAAEQRRKAAERAALAGGDYAPGPGDPDLYRYFCQRYRALLRPGGRLGVVLPRSAFNAKGSTGFREWLQRETTVHRVDFLLNKARWAFDAEPRYSVALLAAQNTRPPKGHRIEAAGTADSAAAWEEQAASPGIRLPESAFGPDGQLPMLRSQEEADLLGKLRLGTPFPLGGGRWTCFAVRELDETNDKRLWSSGAGDRELWKGASFDQFDPNGAGSRPIGMSAKLRKKIEKPRPGSGQLAGNLPLPHRQRAVLAELKRARVAFRDVSSRTNSRTAIACLIPPGVLLTNTAPYLAFAQGDERSQAAALGILNSLPFDWQARRYVEIHLSLFILNSLIAPELTDEDYGAIADAAARLSAVDDRYTDFAAATGVACGELADEERQRLRVEIDARVARAWNLTGGDLEVLLEDFTDRAVPPTYREALRRRFRELSRGIP